MWIPKGNGYIWEPVNFSNVISKGFELNADFKYSYRSFDTKINLNYAFAHSTDNSKRNEGTQGRQLPYIPRNRWNINYSASLSENLCPEKWSGMSSVSDFIIHLLWTAL